MTAVTLMTRDGNVRQNLNRRVTRGMADDWRLALYREVGVIAAAAQTEKARRPGHGRDRSFKRFPQLWRRLVQECYG
jgi:hypothetical protein